MRDGEKVEEMQFVKVYRAPKVLKISTAAAFVVIALLMVFMPAYKCDFDSSGVSGEYKLAVGSALTEIGSSGSYIMWLSMFVLFVSGIVFILNTKPKIIPVAASALLTFATFYSSVLLNFSGEARSSGIVKEYAKLGSFYIVLAANFVLLALTIVVIIKTKKKVELKFGSDE